MTISERFWAKVDCSGGPDVCHPWQASCNAYGYGQFNPDGVPVLAHRQARLEEYGPDSIPEDMCVLHQCDNPPCCNVTHLFLGTQAENMADMNAKGRQSNGNRARTHCLRNHPLSGSNLYVTPDNRRICKECRRTRAYAAIAQVRRG